MSPKKPLLLTSLLSLTVSCGLNKKGDSTQEIVPGMVISGSKLDGLAFSATGLDQSFAHSDLYYYEFASGNVRRLLQGESGNPLLFWEGDQLFFFNSQATQKNVRIFDPRQSARSIPSSIDLPDLTAGDPFALAMLRDSNTALLASPIAGALQTLNIASGTIETFSIDQTVKAVTKPVDFYRSQDQLFVLNNGVNSQDTINGSQQIFVLQDGATLKALDQNPATALFDSLAITPSYPTAFIEKSSAIPYVVGLCRQDLSGCVAGVDRLDPEAIKTSVIKEYPTNFGFAIVNQIIDGPSSGTVYAHVKRTANDHYEIIELNLASQAAKTIHTFSDARLYGMFYDKSSDTLFVGDQNQEQDVGVFDVYQAGEKIGSFDLNGIPEKGVFVP